MLHCAAEHRVMGSDQTSAQQPPLPAAAPPPLLPPAAAQPSSSPTLRPFSALTATFPSSATIASASISRTRPPAAAPLHSPLALPSSAPPPPSTGRQPSHSGSSSGAQASGRLRLERASASASAQPRPALPNAEHLKRTVSSVSAVSSASTSSPSQSPSSSPSSSSQPPPSSSAPSSSPGPAHRSGDVEPIAELLCILSPKQAQAAAVTALGSDEEAKLDSFLISYARCYSFPSAHHRSLFSSLCQHRLLSPAFESGIARQHRLRILRTLRVLSREQSIQRLLMRHRQPLQALAEQFRRLVPEFFSLDPPYCSEMLVEICSMFRRIAERSSWQRRLFSCGVHELLVQLLSCRDAAVLQSVLLTLIHLSSSSLFLQEMLKLPCIDPLLQLIQERNATPPAAALALPPATPAGGDAPSTREWLPASHSSSALSAAGGGSPSSTSCTVLSFPAASPAAVALPPPLSSSSSASTSSSSSSSSSPSSDSSSFRYQCLAGDLLDVMCESPDCRHEVRMQSGNRILVSLLMSSAGDEVLQLRLLRCLASMALDEDSSREIRYLGGIPLLLQLIACETGRDGRWQTPSLPLTIAVCTALTHLANDDESANQICRQQGIVALTQLLLISAACPPSSHSQLNAESSAHVLRLLRFLYSVERNRKAFKRLFPSSLFCVFVDIGHWKYELRLYEEAVSRLQSLRAQDRQQMWAAMEELRQSASESRANRRLIRGYAVMEVLGRGGFGTVYRVVKEGGESVYAMKEISLRSIATSCSGEEREAELRAAVEAVCREVDILSQLDHPNIVRYFSSFVDGGCLYIVMELVEGQSLLEYITGCSDRQQAVSEEIIWPVFIQLCLALSYLHIDKQVVHRDLTCNNIMIDPRRRVKVMDLGLALQRRRGDAAADAGGRQQQQLLTDKPMGTIAFSCPELVTHQACSDKADIWSLGCVLYQMATGRPAFGGDNPFAVAQKVVRGAYAPLDAAYSPLLHEMVKRLLTVDPRQRPDILQVCFLLSPLMMAQLDRVRGSCLRLEAELQHEQETRKKEMDEWTREKQAWRKIMQSRGRGGAGGEQQLQQALHARSQQQHALAVVAVASSQSLPLLHSEEYVTTEPSSGSSTGSEGATPTPLPPAAASAGVLPSSHSRSRQQSMLSISPTRMRPIADPVSELLCQLHKVVWVSQLPPSLNRDAKRSIVCRYKQALFRQPHWRGPLKQEMQSLLTMQPAFIHSRWGINCDDIASAAQAAAASSSVAAGSGSSGALASASSSAALPVSGRVGLPQRVTYEDLHLMIEQILKEEGYYDVGGELDVDMELAAAAAVAGTAAVRTGSSGHHDWSERESGQDEKGAGESGGERGDCRLQRGGDRWPQQQQQQQQMRDSEPSDGDTERERLSQRRRQHHSASKVRQRAAASAAAAAGGGGVEEKLQPSVSPSASTSPPRRHRPPADASSARKESADARHRESRRRKEEGRTPRKESSASSAAAVSKEKDPRRMQETKVLTSAPGSASSTSSSAASSAASSPRLFPSARRLSASSTLSSQSQPPSRGSDAAVSSASPSPSPSPPRVALAQSMSQLSLSSRAMPVPQPRFPPPSTERAPKASRILFSS